jgi:hypothetical protein
MLAEYERIDAALWKEWNTIGSTKPKAARSRHPLTFTTPDGEVRPYTYTMSEWYRRYIDQPQLGSRHWSRKFRRHFRLPYQDFLLLLDMVRNDPMFDRWKPPEKGFQKRPSPISLLLLGTFRYLGRGWTFDDLDEATGISEEVHRVFFHVFIQFGASRLYDEYVTKPCTPEDAADCSAEYTMAGFNGAVGSTDATHIVCDRIHDSLSQQHKGHKLPFTAWSYNLTCNHRHRILNTTRGFPAQWNDKMIVRYDCFVTGLKSGEHLQNAQFWLYRLVENGGVIKQKYCGAWLLVDGSSPNNFQYRLVETTRTPVQSVGATA